MTEVEIPPQSARLIAVPAGAHVEIEDPHGTQIGDLWAFARDDPREHLSVGHTRIAISRLFPRPGEAFWSSRMRPLLTLVEDRSPGIHDTLCAPCDPHLYRWLGAGVGHPSCHENLLAALRDAGVAVDAAPPSVNLFQDTPIGEDGVMRIRPAASRPGDAIVFRAETDVAVVVASCSMDVWGVNGARCTPLRARTRQP